MNSTHFSCSTPVFHGIQLPEQGLVVGYAAVINSLKLPVPIPNPLALVSNQNKKYFTDDWNIFPNKYLPEDNAQLTEIEALYNHLVFALKYEGVNLLVFSFLTKHYSIDKFTELVNIEPTGQYSRKIWFIVEWITGNKLQQKENLSKKSYVPLLDDKLQYTVEGIKSPRHLIINNLPGTPDFCPLIRKTKKLENYIASNIADQQDKYLKDVQKDVLQRASAFLLLKDSKASFTIEGESPKSKRAARWGQVIGQAGSKDISKVEFLRLQQIVIESDRFVKMGFRKDGGFVGEHDRSTGEPLPDHISAKWQDLDLLIEGLLKTNQILLNSSFNAVLSASIIAFGFVFIHPFEDGNGRIHRYLIHHLLAKKHFSQQGIIFPISASILDHIDDYRNVLESYSNPLLDFIEWKGTKDHNVEVLNDTIDYYKYFDATKQAEFLYFCVNDTIQNIIPTEVSYLSKYDQFKTLLEDDFEMPDKMIALIVRFLSHNEGSFSKRAKEREFVELTGDEIKIIEETYKRIFH